MNGYIYVDDSEDGMESVLMKEVKEIDLMLENKNPREWLGCPEWLASSLSH